MSFLFNGEPGSLKKNIINTAGSASESRSPYPFERAFSAAPHSNVTAASALRASLTIEAAMILPVFLFFIAGIMHFLILMSLQSDLQLHIDEAARDMSRLSYITDSSNITSALAINSATIKAAIIDDELREKLDSSQIVDGAAGVHTILSSYDASRGILDIVVTYSYRFPFFPESIGKLNFIQRCRCRSWTGKEISDSDDDSETEEGRTVYITPTGTVYHCSESCPYLDLSIRGISLSSVSRLRNHSGGIYYPCSCFTGSSTVYITDYGTLYHSDYNCTALRRTVLAIDISKVGSRKACSKCGKEY